MRNAFADEILALAEQDERVVLLSADIGNRLFDTFKERYPHRFYNCGVAEANMIGVAAGLAMSGLRPVCYTIANFITYRCMEQIRIDLCYHYQPVIIVGTGAGLSYASLGATHHTCEEMGMLRLLPGLVIIAPADQREARCALRAALKQDSPVYLRLGKKGEPAVHTIDPDFKIGRGIFISERNDKSLSKLPYADEVQDAFVTQNQSVYGNTRGFLGDEATNQFAVEVEFRKRSDVCLLSTGNMLPTALETAELLAQSNCSTSVVSFHTIKPLDEELLRDIFQRFRCVATIEEHSILGGLGGSIAEWLSDHPESKARLIRCGTRDEFLHTTCNQKEARKIFGLTAEALTQKIISSL